MRRLAIVSRLASLAAGVGLLVAGCGGPAQHAPSVVKPPPKPVYTVTRHASGHVALLVSAIAATQGQTLTANPGTWSGNPTPVLTERWQRCDSAGASCVDIASATGLTYPVQSADVGKTLRAVVTGTNSLGSSSVATPVTAVVTGSTGTVTFEQNFETGPYTTPGTPGGLYTGIQAGNWSGQSNGALHYFGDAYIDNGTGTSPTTNGTKFNLAAFGNVSPGDGSNSMRIVQPVPPSGDCPGCPAGQGYILQAVTENALPVAAPGDLGQDKYYGEMIYIPGDEPSTNSIGESLWEFHFNGVDGPPIGWSLHTAGPEAANGDAQSVGLDIETGACNAVTNHQTGATTGCKYRSNVSHPPCNIAPDPVIGTVTCLPNTYVVPPGALVDRQWMEIVMHVHFAADTSGVIDTYYRPLGTSTWTQSSHTTGIPTVQWNAAVDGTTCDPGEACGFPVHDEIEGYGGLMTSPWSYNQDDQLVATSLAAAQNAMPTGAAAPVAPTNSALPGVTGTTVQGQALSTSNGTWNGSPTPTFTYQWQRCDAAGASCTNIASATSSSYTLTATDVTHTIRSVVTATNTAGTASATSPQSAVVTGLVVTVGTGASQATCPSGCGAVQMLANSVSVPDGAGKNYNRSIAAFFPSGLAGSVPVVLVFGDGAACTTVANCVDGAQAFFNIGAAKRFITLRVACTGENGVCSYQTPDVAPYVLSAFQHCGASGTALCNDAAMAQYLIQTWIPANIHSWCTGGSCTLDTSRVFVEGGSKGSSMVMEQVCSPLTGNLISGAFATSTTALSSTTTTGGPPLASAAVSCPYHLIGGGATGSSWTYSPAGNGGHILMMGYEDSIVDQSPSQPNGALLSNNHWQYGEDQQVQYMSGPDFGCPASATSSLVLSHNPGYTGTNNITGNVYNCAGPNRQTAIYINGPTSTCHAGACDGDLSPNTSNMGFEYGPEMWSFWTTGTLF